MGQRRWTTTQLVLTIAAVLSLAAPTVVGQTPSSTTQPGIVEQKTVTTNAQGNIVTTERTLLHG